jgi:hypothetical protein
LSARVRQATPPARDFDCLDINDWRKAIFRRTGVPVERCTTG